MSALIIIDLQNDFLSPLAPFKVDAGSHESLKETLEALVPAFRDSGGQIIWVQSHYSLATQARSGDMARVGTQEPTESAVNVEPTRSQGTPSSHSAGNQHVEWVVEGKHTGKKPCCMEGSYGAEFVSWADTLHHPNDILLIKTFFSAFKESKLEQILVDRGITALYFTGLLSNMCVLATSISAVRLASHNRKGWEIYVIIDALAWRREQSHRKALKTMERSGIRLISSETFTTPQISSNVTGETIV